VSIPNPPPVRALPPTPSRANAADGDEFSALMDNHLATLPLWSGDLDDLAQWTYATAVEVASAAGTSGQASATAVAAKNAAEDAAEDAGLARDESAQILSDNQALAAALQSASGLPSLVDKAGYSLVVDVTENAVSWQLIGSRPGDIRIRSRFAEEK